MSLTEKEDAVDLATLKYFVIVAQTEHMNRAAQILNITQPSLSMSIKRLEAELGYQLFDRNGRGIQLNEYGRVFLEGVSNITQIMADTMDEMESLRKTSVGFLKLCCSNSPTNSKLIDVLLSRGINLQVDNIPKSWEAELLGHSCDLVITMGKRHKPGIACTELRPQRLAFVCSKDHPLARVGVITQTELELYPFCSTDAPHSLLNVVREAMPEKRFRPRISFLGRNSSDMIKAIQSGMYIGLMVLRNLPEDDSLKILEVEDFDMSLPINLYWREHDPKTPAMTALRQNVIDFYHALPGA